MKEGIIELRNMLQEIDYYLLKHKDNEIFEVKDISKTVKTKENNTNVSWSTRGAEAVIKVIAYIKNNKIKDLKEGKLEQEVEKELKSRIPQPKKARKIKIGKVRYAGKQTILGNLTRFNKEYIRDLMRLRNFNEMRLIGD